MDPTFQTQKTLIRMLEKTVKFHWTLTDGGFEKAAFLFHCEFATFA